MLIIYERRYEAENLSRKAQGLQNCGFQHIQKQAYNTLDSSCNAHRVYFSDGGKSKWIISWVAVAGWPIPLLVLVPMYFVLGFLSAADNLMYANAYAYLPASTASLLGSTSLIFSTLFGYFTVKNKIINSIVLVTAATVIIALDSDEQYAMGYLWKRKPPLNFSLFSTFFDLNSFILFLFVPME